MSVTAHELETRVHPGMVSVAQEPQGLRLAGYAAVFYNGTPATEFEWGGVIERIRATAFDAVLADDERDVVATFNHDLNNLLGRRSSRTLRISKDDRGLLYEIDLPGTDIASDLTKLVARGDVRGSSIAFVVRKETFEQSGGKLIRWLEDVDLVELGPVVIPAFPGTTTELANWKEYIMTRSKSFFLTPPQKRGVVPFEPTPALDTEAWDEDAVLAHLRDWASKEGAINWEQYRRAFAWYDENNAESFEAYKLPHHDVVKGELVVSRAGVIAAMRIALENWSELKISDADRQAVYDHLVQHYAQFDMVAPDLSGRSLVELCVRRKIAEAKLKLAGAQMY